MKFSVGDTVECVEVDKNNKLKLNKFYKVVGDHEDRVVIEIPGNFYYDHFPPKLFVKLEKN